MKAAIFRGKGSIEVGERPDPQVGEPTDAVVRVVRGCVCGSDLWYYRGVNQHKVGSIGHEYVVEQVGEEVRSLAVGDLVIASFTALSDVACTGYHVADAHTAMDQRRAIKSLLAVSQP